MEGRQGPVGPNLFGVPSESQPYEPYQLRDAKARELPFASVRASPLHRTE